jgi:hypothetical protein
MDIGIAASFVSLSATNKNIDVGFCACIQNSEELITTLGVEPVLFLGLGYRSNELQHYCPVYRKKVNVPSSDHDTKIPMNDYIKYVHT